MQSKKKIILRDILPKTGDYIIEYRTYLPDGTDVLAGYCCYKNNELIPLDGDTYSLNDELLKYSTSQTIKYITVWYESKWI